jgi:hypothetical protein
MVIGTSSFLDPDTFCGTFAENLLVEGIWRKPLRRTQSTRLNESVGDEPYRYWGSPECPWRLVGGASARTIASGADAPSGDTAAGHEITLNEEEISDVSLATFYVFDKENVRTLKISEKLAEAVGAVEVVGAAEASEAAEVVGVALAA